MTNYYIITLYLIFGLDEIGHYLSRTNITAHINEINKMLADGGSIVLYSEKQLEDLRSTGVCVVLDNQF
jgi:hypothetical protein